ncbi:MAG TPA: ABC transporter ATP-binding protein [Dehalococcoidia bacterium]|nr:ABC transporter ATP-binding protein [Dehalococcoidia bacterium]
MNILEVMDLRKTYSMGNVHVDALDGVSFSIPSGDMLCIMGKSGSGKSTLLRQLGLLDRPTSGTILLDGKHAAKLSDGARADLRLNFLGYVFQEYALLGELTAHENVYLPGMMLGKKGSDFKRKAAELLELVGLEGRLKHLPRELSGGEQQRVAIARSLINDPKIVFADEPCANLDTISSKTVMQTLVKLNGDMGVTVIFVSHDPDDRKYACNVILLSDGRIIQGDYIV